LLLLLLLTLLLLLLLDCATSVLACSCHAPADNTRFVRLRKKSAQVMLCLRACARGLITQY